MNHPIYNRPLMTCDLQLSDHHVFHPKTAYRTKVEIEFRELECNIIRNIPRWLHDILDQYIPPKPTEAFMLEIIHMQRKHQPSERKRA